MGGARTTRRWTTLVGAAVLVIALAACDPPAPPTVTVRPSTGILDEGRVQVSGTVTRGAGRSVAITEVACEDTVPAAVDCTDGPSTTAPVDSSGRYRASLLVRRVIGALDCSRGRYPVPDCDIRVRVLRPDGRPDAAVAPTRTLIRFAPPAPSFAVSPTTGLVDRSIVQVRFADDDRNGTPVKVRQRVCDRTNPTAPVCAAGPSVRGTLDDDGRLTLSLTVRRVVGGMDCARTRHPIYDCEVEALVVQTPTGPPDPAYDGFRRPIRFAPA